MCDVLKELYYKVFGEPFEFDPDHRIRLQKTVYILENLGVHIGNYSFVWARRGPYSIALDDDAHRCSLVSGVRDVKFSSWAEDRIGIVKELLKDSVDYSTTEWLECVSSIHYMKYILRMNNENDSVLDELSKLKPSLNSRKDNECALLWADRIENAYWET